MSDDLNLIQKKCGDGFGSEVVHRTGAKLHWFGSLSATWDTLNRLVPGNEADDMVINVWSRELMRHWTEGVRPLGKDVFIFDTQFYRTEGVGSLTTGGRISSLMRRYTERTVDKRGVLGLMAFDMVAVPVHCPDRNHWEFGIVDFENKRFEYYDSLSHSQNKRRCEDFAANMTRFFQVYARIRGVLNINMAKWPRRFNTGIWDEPMPVQHDSTSCGYCMLTTLEQRVLGRAPLHAVGTKMQRRMAAHLLTRYYSS